MTTADDLTRWRRVVVATWAVLSWTPRRVRQFVQPRAKPALVAITEMIGFGLIAYGIGLWFLPAGVIAAGVAAVMVARDMEQSE